MFGATPIRYLSPSEEFYAQAENFIGLTLTLRGALDVGAMSEAFDTLLRVHPAHAGHLERDADGRHQIMVDDYEHEGIWLEKPGDEPGGRLPSQTEALLNLRIRLGRTDPPSPSTPTTRWPTDTTTFALLEQLFGWYTDIVSGAGVGTVKAEPIPESLEAVLAERGIGKLARFGLERFLPAIFAYDLPRRSGMRDALARSRVRVPSASCRLSQQETKDLAGVCADRRISVNAVVAAAILMAEWRIRETPHLPIPYIYPVDLRFFLTPPVGATEATNPLGMAMFLAEIRSDTDLMDLARDILEAFRADLADGVIQQSFLHFGTEYQGNPPGLPDVVMATDGGDLPPLRTPPGLVVEQYDLEVLFASTAAGVDMYSAGTYDGQLLVSYNSHGPEPQRYVAEIRDLLTAVPAAHGRVTGLTRRRQTAAGMAGIPSIRREVRRARRRIRRRSRADRPAMPDRTAPQRAAPVGREQRDVQAHSEHDRSEHVERRHPGAHEVGRRRTRHVGHHDVVHRPSLGQPAVDSLRDPSGIGPMTSPQPLSSVTPSAELCSLAMALAAAMDRSRSTGSAICVSSLAKMPETWLRAWQSGSSWAPTGTRAIRERFGNSPRSRKYSRACLATRAIATSFTLTPKCRATFFTSSRSSRASASVRSPVVRPLSTVGGAVNGSAIERRDTTRRTVSSTARSVGGSSLTNWAGRRANRTRPSRAIRSVPTAGAAVTGLGRPGSGSALQSRPRRSANVTPSAMAWWSTSITATPPPARPR